MKNITHPYFLYYNRAIAQDQNGFKFVQGGTGLGKTSALADVVRHTQTERKFIYCANRIQLLNEMAERLEEAGIQYVHLRNDTDVLLSVLIRQADEFYRLLSSPLINKYVTQINHKTSIYPLDVLQIKRACEYLERSRDIRHLGLLDETIRIQAGVVLNFFKRILAETVKIGTDKQTRDYETLAGHPVVRALFPYITFKADDAVKVLLITIQKAFYGFFDGRENISLTGLQDRNGQNIIFLDEFDFLESNLIDLICGDTQIEAPFKFVEFFYGAMKRHKLPLEEYPISENVRQRIEKIVQTVDDLRTQGISFPEINQFTCSLPDLRSTAIFQTNRTVVDQPLYLKETTRSFDIVADRTASDGAEHLNAMTLFSTIQSATVQILFLFKELEAENPIIHREMLRHCYETTTFKDQLGRIRQLPHGKQKQATRFDNLLDSGFGLYEIQDLQQETDKEEVEFRHYAIYTTPEKILLSLVRHNLVFGLSATADIPRIVRSFSEDWLRRQAGFTFFEVDEQDAQIIQSLNQQKQMARDNRVRVELAGELDVADSEQKKLADFIKAIAQEDGFGGDDHQGYRRKRVERFFATLRWIAQAKDKTAIQTDTHLLFFNSYKQIEHIFAHHRCPEENLFTIQIIDDEAVFRFYQIHIFDTDFIVIFYNAKRGQLIESEIVAKKQYHRLFWQNKPVILVTTYPTAGNGVNLQYYPDPDSSEEKDFKNIHLLEGPYFYFGRIDSENTTQENNAIIKQNIWYLAKLYEAKIISEREFKNHLSNIRNKALSSRYKNDPSTSRDSLLNQLAAYIQALGRVERVWTRMDDQTIRLSREIYQVLEVFCTRPQYEYLRQRRQNTISNNLQQLFDQITEQARANKKVIRRVRDERLAVSNQASQAKVRELLDRLVHFRQGSEDTGAKKEWLNLRQATLKHDFHSQTLKRYDCLFETDYYRDGLLHINDKLELFPPDIWHNEITVWNLNSVYHTISDNEVIRRRFEHKGYELGFNNLTRQFFTPYCYQAILVGAIGEEAIKAILWHEDVPLEAPDDPLFEIADTKIAGFPWYIDCKNFSERTLETFPLTADDPAWRPNLNEEDFKPAARRKLATIRNYHAGAAEQCKLIYINLVSIRDRIKRYFDAEFNPVDDFNSAKIIVIQGVINQEQPDEYNEAFTVFLHHLQSSLQSIPEVNYVP